MFVHSERARVIIYVFPFFEDWLLAMLAMLTRARGGEDRPEDDLDQRSDHCQ